MSYLVLARKYRPQTFDQVVEQTHVTRTLSNAITSGRVAHAILFSGPRGTGKTTVARILAKAMNCAQGPTPSPCNECRSCKEITSGNAVDVFEIDGASNNSVDQIRELRENVKYMPAHSPYKIYIIDEVHMLSMAAFNALLKTLEEPPEHILFMFATTEVHKIPVTILSRCQRHDFRRIDIEALAGHMGRVCTRENFEIPSESLWLLAREAQGSVRDALSLLDQVMACSQNGINHEQLLEVLGIIDRKFIFDFGEALLKADVGQLLNLLDASYTRGHDMKRLYADLAQHLRNMLVLKIGKGVDKLIDLPANEVELIRKQTAGVNLYQIRHLFDLFFQAEATIKFATQPKLALEMLFIKLLETKPALPIEVLIEKLDQVQKSFQSPASQSETETSPGSETGAVPPPRSVNPPQKETPFRPAAPQPEPPPQTEPAGKPSDPERIWQECLEQISEQNPVLAANLTRSTITSVAPDKMEISVEGNGFTRNIVMRPKNIAILKRICKKRFGQSIQVEVRIAENASAQKKNDKQATDRLVQEALSHPLVADVIEIFNAEVVEVKIL